VTFALPTTRSHHATRSRERRRRTAGFAHCDTAQAPPRPLVAEAAAAPLDVRLLEAAVSARLTNTALSVSRGGGTAVRERLASPRGKEKGMPDVGLAPVSNGAASRFIDRRTLLVSAAGLPPPG
jgi:hypothetical protein